MIEGIEKSLIYICGFGFHFFRLGFLFVLLFLFIFVPCRDDVHLPDKLLGFRHLIISLSLNIFVARTQHFVNRLQIQNTVLDHQCGLAIK